MIVLKNQQVWLLTGSQHLYGPETLRQVEANAQHIASGLDGAAHIPVSVVAKPVLTTPDAITACIRQANGDPACIGIICWMHTFSPAQMWIAGLSQLDRPMCHLHTQFNREIPFDTIDMDFMNLNQSAHGDREFGFMVTRLGINRKVVVGHWQDVHVQQRLGVWSRAAAAWHDSRSLRIVRFGDNMRQVAVTEGDKVEARIRFGYQVSTHGVGDLVARLCDIADARVDGLCDEYEQAYDTMPQLKAGGAKRKSLRDAARIELALRSFLSDGGFNAFTDTFEDLHGLPQLPGIASQRLMADGYGFGAEGDWKHAALVRAMKVMAHGLPGGTSFMEDYTYHLGRGGGRVLGAHMLEICPSIAASRPRCEVHPLGIGGKEDPVRLVFDSATGPAVNVSVVDLGDRFRMLVNEVTVVEPGHPLPNLPVARAVWEPAPDLPTAAASWIHAGGAHHTGFSLSLSAEHLEDFADMAGIECLIINGDSTVRQVRNELRWNAAAFRRGG